MTRQRIEELLLGAWHWLPVRGQVLVVVLVLAQLYWVRWFYVYYIRGPIALYQKSSTPRDMTRTLDPAYPEPIDDELLHFLEANESRLAAMGFVDPHRTTNLKTYPLTLARLEVMQNPVVDRLRIGRIEGARRVAGGGALEIERDGRTDVIDEKPPHPVQLRDREDDDEDLSAHRKPVPDPEQQLFDALTGHESRGEG